MSQRSEIFRFRLSPAEQERLQREADERGLESKAERIRDALGWLDRPLDRPTDDRPAGLPIRQPAPPASTAPPDPARQPGAAAIEELAKRIYGGEGVPMSVARARARERLKPAA